MCGFAGWVGIELAPSERDRVLALMANRLSRRGPDDESIRTASIFQVAFRRLAIVDSAGGRQPFVSSDGRYVVAVNGEIYNYKNLYSLYLPNVMPASDSDCEVVMHLFQKYGPNFVGMLNGIFSIAVWDDVSRTLFLARDRLGVKPLYVAPVSHGLIFSSELKALVAHPSSPRRLDLSCLEHVPNSVYPYERSNGVALATGIQGIQWVDPAQYLIWRDGYVSNHNYWSPFESTAHDKFMNSTTEVIERYKNILEDSVKIQLMSEYPVGICLSGGVDSSLLASIAKKIGCDLTAFSLRSSVNEISGDAESARDIAQILGIPFNSIAPDDRNAAGHLRNLTLQDVEELIWALEQPLFEPEILLKEHLYRTVKKSHPNVKVLLIGQGADEFAGGYSGFAAPDWLNFASMESRAYRIATNKMIEVSAPLRPYIRLARQDGDDERDWQRIRLGDLAAYNLWHEDRTSASNGREIRVPYLDHRLVELLCSIPTKWHSHLFYDKRIVREVARQYIPETFAMLPKVPFFAGGLMGVRQSEEMMKLASAAIFQEFCSSYLSQSDSLFNHDEIERLYSLGDRGYPAANYLLMKCMSVAIFQRKFCSA